MAGEPTQSDVEAMVVRVRADGRRVYDVAAKRAIVQQSLRPGVSVARVALEHGINANLLRKWIVKHGHEQSTPALLPVVIKPTRSRRKLATPPARPNAPIEIELAAGLVRFYGAIDATVLRTLVDVLGRR